MRHLLASLTLGLALLWGQGAFAAPALGAQLGTLATGSVASPQYLSTTVDDHAGNLTIVGFTASASGTAFTITDSAGNTYSSPNSQTFNTSSKLLNAFSNTTVDLPAPCTVTATETSTTLVVTAAVSCSGTDVLSVGQAISGGSFTGIIASPCTLVAGAATCTITGGATVSTPGTATISSTIKFSYTGSLALNGAAAYFTGMATSSPADVTGTIATGTSTTNTTISPAPSTGTLAQASEVVIGETGIVGSFTAYSSQTPFTDTSFAGPPTGTTPNFQWGYDIVSSTASVAYGPKWTTGRVYGANAYSYKSAGAAAVGNSNLLLLGVDDHQGAPLLRDSLVYRPATDIVGHEKVWFPHGSAGAPVCGNYATDGGCAGANQASTFLITTYAGYLSGNTSPAASFYAHAAGNGTGGVGGGQTWTSAHPWTWNSPGVSYPVGYYTPKGSLQDPATASAGSGLGQIPTGCAYQATGNAGGPRIYCNTGASSPTIQGFDLSLHGGVLVYFSNNVTGTCSVIDNNLENGASTNIANGYLVQTESSAACNFVSEFNTVDGNYENFNNTTLVSDFGLTGTGSITVKYNAVINSPQRPMTSNTCGPIDVEDNYVEGIVMSSLSGSGEHGEVLENIKGSCPGIVETYQDNVVVFPTAAPAQEGSGAWDLGTGNGNNSIIASATVNRNIVIANESSGSYLGHSNTVSAAIIEVSWSSFSSISETNNFLDTGISGLGTIACNGNVGSGTGWHGSISGTTFTLTTLPTNHQVWPSTVGDASTAPLSGTGITGSPLVEPYGTTDPNTGLASTGTGLNTGTYILSVNEGTVSAFTNGAQSSSRIGTLVQTNNLTLQTGGTITGFNSAPGSATCPL